MYLKQAIDVNTSLDIRTSLLWRYPRMHLSSTLQDAHIYIFKRWVIDILSREPKISSIRTDLLPALAKMQWQSNLRKQLQVDNCTSLVPLTNLTSSPSWPNIFNSRPARPISNSRKLESRLPVQSIVICPPTISIHSARKLTSNIHPPKPASSPPRSRSKETSVLKSRLQNLRWQRLLGRRELQSR